MKKILWLIFVMCSCFHNLNAQPFNYLPAAGANQVISYSEFTLSYNEEHEQAEWVAYELTKEEAEISRDRCNCFMIDTNVAAGSASHIDYISRGFDRGHFSPAADNNITETANRESFLFSNMSPQLPFFNRGIWEDLEEWVRQQAALFDTVFVVTGPVFINNLGTMGTNEVTIPGYYYKMLLRFGDDGPRSIAFLLPQVGASGEIRDYIVAVNTIETLTGIDFYPALSNSIENSVEAQLQPARWGGL